MQLIPNWSLVTDTVFTAVNAEGSADAGTGGGGSSGFLIVMLILFAVLIFFSMRASRKQQKKQVETRQAMVPGTEVMTSSGIFGTIRTVDLDNNKLELEIAPATVITVHLGAITTIVNQDEPAAGAVGQSRDEYGNPAADTDGGDSTDFTDKNDTK